MKIDEKLQVLFDYQKFEGNETLENVIKDEKDMRRNSLKMLSEEELGLVSGGQDYPGIVPYDVKAGETLASIAAKHGVSVQKLMELNSVTEEDIKPGMKIIVIVQ